MTRFASFVFSMFLIACSDSSDDAAPAKALADFTMADAWLERFVVTEALFPGGSMIIVDKTAGVIHKSAFGNQSEDSVVLLASTSKVPTVTLLMALHEDDANVNFDISAPIANYLPWLGVWDPAITTENLVSNRSGIPGLLNIFTRPDDYSPHLCQFLPAGTLLACAETLFTTPLPNLPSVKPNTVFDYGGSQWQLAGGVAELVGGATWQQLWDQYIAEPCGLQIARFGNNLSLAGSWDGSPAGLVGLENPNMEGGMMSDLDDYAKLLSLHLNDGACGGNQVLSPESVAFMRKDRSPEVGYGMGWWIKAPAQGDNIYLYDDPGYYGSIAWLDIERGYGGVVFFEEYSGAAGGVGSGGVASQLISIIEEALDAAR